MSKFVGIFVPIIVYVLIFFLISDVFINIYGYENK